MIPNDTSMSLWDLLKLVLSGFGALALWVVRGFHTRQLAADVAAKDLLEKVRELELNTISRPTFNRHEKDTKDSIDAMRRDILSEIRGLGNRVDNIFEKLSE